MINEDSWKGNQSSESRNTKTKYFDWQNIIRDRLGKVNYAERKMIEKSIVCETWLDASVTITRNRRQIYWFEREMSLSWGSSH